MGGTWWAGGPSTPGSLVATAWALTHQVLVLSSIVVSTTHCLSLGVVGAVTITTRQLVLAVAHLAGS